MWRALGFLIDADDYSRSIHQLQNTINPVAEQVSQIHGILSGDLDIRIDQIHQAILSIQDNLNKNPDRMSTLSYAGGANFFPQQSSNAPISPPRSPYLDPAENQMPPSSPLDSNYSPLSGPLRDNGPISPVRLAAEDPFRGSPINSFQDGSPTLSNPFERSPATTMVPTPNDTAFSMRSGYSKAGSQAGSSYSTPAMSQRQPTSSFRDMTIGSPMIPAGSQPQHDNDRIQVDPEVEHMEHILPAPAEDDDHDSIKFTTTREEQQTFVRNLMTNAVILSESQASSVSFTVPDERKHGDYLMKEACSKCTVYLITRQRRNANGESFADTSIWVLSDDGKTRMRQEIKDEEEVIPYTIWNNEKNVILRVPTKLKFYDAQIDSRPMEARTTSWVTYSFVHERAATLLQNALLGENLLLSVKTKSTMRVHEGIASPFLFAEKMCVLENLRVFANPHTGIASVLLHFTPDFSDGYLRFPIVDIRKPIKIVEESDNVVRVKGLDLKVVAPDPRRPSTASIGSMDGEGSGTRQSVAGAGGQKKQKDKAVKAVKIEFSTPMDKKLFVDKWREIQNRFYGEDAGKKEAGKK